jgi:hypothetical protein
MHRDIQTRSFYHTPGTGVRSSMLKNMGMIQIVTPRGTAVFQLLFDGIHFLVRGSKFDALAEFLPTASGTFGIKEIKPTVYPYFGPKKSVGTQF